MKDLFQKSLVFVIVYLTTEMSLWVYMDPVCVEVYSKVARSFLVADCIGNCW